MESKLFKKLFSMMLVVAMVLSMCPSIVFAEGTDTPDAQSAPVLDADGNGCPHCEGDVTWVDFNAATHVVDGVIQTTDGHAHYKLTGNISGNTVGYTYTNANGGKYYVKYTSKFAVAKGDDVVIDLNGHYIRSNDGSVAGIRIFINFGTLSVMDSVGTGYITGGNMSAGSSSADGSSSSKVNPVCVGANIYNQGTFNLYSGTIKKGRVATGSVYGYTNGGNIYGDAGSVINIYGGTVSNGIVARGAYTQSSYHAGGGNIASAGEVNIYGGTITGGQVNTTYSYNGDRNVYFHGGNIYIYGNDTRLNTSGATSTNDALNIYGGTIQNGVVNVTKTNVDKETAIAQVFGGNISCKGAPLTISGGTISGGSLTSTANGTTSAAASAYAYGGNIYSISSTVTISGGTITGGSVTAVGNAKEKQAYTCARGGAIYAESDVTISGGTIDGCALTATSTGTGTTGNGTGRAYANGSVIAIRNKTLTITGGTLTGSTATANATGVSFTTTTPAIAYVYGGSIFSEDGAVSITGDAQITGGENVTNAVTGEGSTSETASEGSNQGGLMWIGGDTTATTVISGNAQLTGGSAVDGGVIYTGKPMTISGNAWIKGGYADTYGGNLYLANGGDTRFEDNAKVTGGRCDYNGGNIYMTGGSTQVYLTENAEISGGIAAAGGGNLFANSSSDFYMTGGTMKDGTSNWSTTGTYWGGGNMEIFNGASAAVSGGTISGGTGKLYCNSITVRSNATLKFYGGTVLGTDAENDLPLYADMQKKDGYGLFLYNGTFAFDPADYLATCACAEKTGENEWTVWHTGLQDDGTACTADNCSYTATSLTVDKVCQGKHTGTLSETITEPSCTDDGEGTYVCDVCGDTYTDVIPATGHNMIEQVEDKYQKTPADCENAAVYWKSCSVCGEKSEDTFVSGDPLGHSFTAETVKDEAKKSDADCENAAVYYKSCVRCGLVSEDDADVFESGEALGHNYGAWQQHSAAQHIRVCGRCGNEELQDHENGDDRICDVCNYESACIHEWDEGVVTPNSCTEGGYTTYTCDLCGETKIDDYTDPTGHTLTAVEKVETSCLASGHQAYWYCACGAHFADENGLSPIEDIDAWLAGDGFIAKLDHEYDAETGICGNGCNNTICDNEGHDTVQVGAQAPTCTEKGWNAYEYCTRCDYTTYVELPAAHTIVKVDAKAPTCTEVGWDAYEYCSVCDDYTTYNELPATGHNYVLNEEKTKFVCSACGDEKDASWCEGCEDYAMWQEWDGKSAFPASGHYRLTADATMTGTVTISDGQTICLDLAGNDLTAAEGKRAFVVGGVMKLMDSTAHTEGETYVAGSIIGSYFNKDGANIYVYGGDFTFTSGILTDGQTTTTGYYGGNLYVTGSGVAYIKGGLIKNGKAARGGNVYGVGKIYISGGIIEDGRALKYDGASTSARGGNIAMSGDLYISGGIIRNGGMQTAEGNTLASSGYGGNIMSTGGILHISGGTITGGGTNTDGFATAYGGNIALMYAEVYITGGTITGGTASYGGNLYSTTASQRYNALVKITGGTFSEGSGTESGDNLYIAKSSGATLEDEYSVVEIFGGVFEAGKTGKLDIYVATSRKNTAVNIYGGSFAEKPAYLTDCSEYCYEDGYYVFWHAEGTCESCGHTFGDEPCTHSVTITVTDGNGENAKNQTWTCNNSTIALTHAVTAPLAHDWSDATCTTPATCSKCGQTTGDVDADNHTLTPTAAKPSTCTEAGHKAYWYCSVCEKYFSDEACQDEIADLVVWLEGDGYVAPIDHTYDQQNTADQYKASDATCTAAATYYYSCECGAKGELTFSYGEKNLDNHTNLVEEEAKAPTCTDIGWNEYELCSACGHTTYEELPVDKDNHTNLEQEEAKAPTCTEDGWKAYEHCDACGYSTYENDPKTGHTYTYTSNGDKATHTIGCEKGDYTATGDCTDENGDKLCDFCGQKLLDPVVIVYTVDGSKEFESLQEAINASEEGCEYWLQKDIVLTERLTIDKIAYFNLNDHSITGNFDDAFGMVYVKKAVYASFNNGTIENAGGIAIGNYGFVELGAETTVTGADAAIYNFYYQADYYGSATVNGKANVIWNCGNLTVGESAVVDYLDNSGAATISGTVTELYAQDGSDCPDVEGAGTLAIANTENVSVPDDYELVEIEAGVYKVVAKTYVAEANGVGYETLEEAIAAGGKVKLLADIEIKTSIKVTNTVSVDLNGYTLTGPDDGKANWYAFIVDGGDLTLTDSTGEGQLYAKCYGVETKSGSFTLDGAKIVATKNGTVGTAVVNYGGTVIIKSGYASGANDAVYTGGYFSNASTSILGGTLDGTVTVENWEAKDFTETVSAADNTYTPNEGQKWVEQDGVYVLTDKVYVAEVNGAQYETLAEALAADGEVKLVADITLTEQVVAVGEIIDLNGYTLSGNIAATLKLNGGNLITAEGYKMIGDEAEYYYSADAVITIAPTTTLDITIHSGTLTLVPNLWYTTVGQTLIIEQAATFVIPEGKTMYVNGSTVTATGIIANYGTLLLAEGAHVKGDIAGTFQMAGGTYETSKYVMIGAADGKYLSTDAIFTIVPNATMDMTIVSGTITLNDPDWWTFAGQTLTIAEAAKFVVPAGKNINVQSTVIVDGTVQIDGTVTLYNADATIKAVEGLENIVANPAAGDTVIYENGVYKVHDHSYSAVVTDPTCTEGGYTTYTCACGDSYVADYTDATGHDHQLVGYTQPTIEKDGYWTYKCHCGDEYTVIDENTRLHVNVPTVDAEDIKDNIETEGTEATTKDIQDVIDHVVHGNEAVIDKDIFVDDANNAVIEQMKQDKPELADKEPVLHITLQGMGVKTEEGVLVAHKLVFDVTPMLGETEIENLQAPLTFHLPVDDSLSGYAYVYHEGEFMGVYEIVTEGGHNYVVVSSQNFSEFTVEVQNENDVAVNMTTGIAYTDLQAALVAAAKGETVKLLKDVTAEEIYVKSGRILDLNGKKLTVTNAFAAAFTTTHVIDSTNGSGLLVVDADGAAFNPDNEYLPIWTTEGVKFTKVSFSQKLDFQDKTGAANENVGFFRFYFNELAADTILDDILSNGTTGTGLEIRVAVSYETEGGMFATQYFAFTSEMVKQYVTGELGWDRSAFHLYLTGVEGLENLTFRAEIASTSPNGMTVVVDSTAASK